MSVVVASILPSGETMIGVLEKTNYWLKNAWKLPLLWVWLGAFILSGSASISMMVRETVIKHIEQQVVVAKEQLNLLKAQLVVVENQAQTSIEDRAFLTQKIRESDKNYSQEIKYLHDELDNTRAALKRLEERK